MTARTAMSTILKMRVPVLAALGLPSPETGISTAVGLAPHQRQVAVP